MQQCISGSSDLGDTRMRWCCGATQPKYKRIIRLKHSVYCAVNTTDMQTLPVRKGQSNCAYTTQVTDRYRVCTAAHRQNICNCVSYANVTVHTTLRCSRDGIHVVEPVPGVPTAETFAVMRKISPAIRSFFMLKGCDNWCQIRRNMRQRDCVLHAI